MIWPFTELKRLNEKLAFAQRDAKGWRVIAKRLSQYAPEPTCRTCSGTNTFPDPADYYHDAERWDGAPLLCLDCRK